MFVHWIKFQRNVEQARIGKWCIDMVAHFAISVCIRRGFPAVANGSFSFSTIIFVLNFFIERDSIRLAIYSSPFHSWISVKLQSDDMSTIKGQKLFLILIDIWKTYSWRLLRLLCPNHHYFWILLCIRKILQAKKRKAYIYIIPVSFVIPSPIICPPMADGRKSETSFFHQTLKVSKWAIYYSLNRLKTSIYYYAVHT